MAHYFDDEFLRRLRNDIPWALLLQRLRWPHKQRHGQLAFLCPRCQEYLSAVNPRTNLGPAFSAARTSIRLTSSFKSRTATLSPPFPI